MNQTFCLTGQAGNSSGCAKQNIPITFVQVSNHSYYNANVSRPLSIYHI